MAYHRIMKSKLVSNQQIQHIKSKGISFNYISEEDAKKYLEQSTYLFKLLSYRKNYLKDASGKYLDLDFQYLVELSKLDRELRYICFDLCMDIEHFVKNKIVQTIVNTSDGYRPISDYFLINPRALIRINEQNTNTCFIHELVNKYSPNFPVWVFVEVSSFGTISSFCSWYNSNYSKTFVDNKILNNVRDLRNAIAHNSCLLCNFVDRTPNLNTPVSEINAFLASLGIGKQTRKNNLHNMFVYDFVCLLYVHKKEVNDKSKLSRLNDFINKRCLENKDYFKNNFKIIKSYNFLKRVIDNI